MYTIKDTFHPQITRIAQICFNLNLRYLRNLRMKIYRWNFWHILI